MIPCLSRAGLRLAVALVLGSTLFATPRDGPPAPGQQTIFRSGVDGVRVDVSVKDGNRPVADLTASTFALTDNGVAQAVEALSIESEPIDVTLLVDTSASTQDVIGRFKVAVQQCAAMLRPIDRVRLVTVSDRVEEIFPMQSPSSHLPVSGMRVGGGTTINDAVVYAFAWDPGPGRRHLIVAFTDGGDNMSTTVTESVVAVASRVDAVMHVVLSDPTAAMTARQPINEARWELAGRTAIVDAAKRSGGDIHHVADAVAAFREVFDAFRQSYTLYYTPQGLSAPGWHDIAVSVHGPNADHLTVLARKGYVGG